MITNKKKQLGTSKPSNSLLESKIRRIVRRQLSESTTVKDFFEDYDDFGPGSEMGINDLLDEMSKWIKDEVEPEDMKVAKLAIKKLYLEKIKQW